MIAYHTKEYVDYKARIHEANELSQLININNAMMNDTNITDRERWELYRFITYKKIDFERKGETK